MCREQIIFDELKTGRPQWPFTSFGAPHFRSLLSNDVSFEEYHLAAMEANRNGTFPDWVSSFLTLTDSSNEILISELQR